LYKLTGQTVKITYKTIILLGVVQGYETWSLTVWKEKLKGVFNNTVLRTTLQPKEEQEGYGRGKISIMRAS
jgi:hypothetical protein